MLKLLRTNLSRVIHNSTNLRQFLPHTGYDRRLFHAAVHPVIKGRWGAKHGDVTYYHLILILTNCLHLLVYIVVNVTRFSGINCL